MGDVFSVARERSFFACDETLMHWLWQQPFGSVFIFGRALLTLYRWPLLGGLVMALLLTAGTWLVGYCLRLRPDSRWRWLQYIPALAWMTWVAWIGLNLYYQDEPGCTLGVLILGVLVCAIDAFIIWTFKGRRPTPNPSRQGGESSGLSENNGIKKPNTNHAPASPLPNGRGWGWVFILLLFAIPSLITHFRHPYIRPLTRMEVQMWAEDWDGMAATARANAKLSYRPLAAYYAIALVQNGHLGDALFDIRLDYDSVYVHNINGAGDICTNYYLIDCDYHAGLFRPATHRAVELLTVCGPSLYTLKHLTRLALLDSDWEVARKYLFILNKTPFEGVATKRCSRSPTQSPPIPPSPRFA